MTKFNKGDGVKFIEKSEYRVPVDIHTPYRVK